MRIPAMYQNIKLDELEMRDLERQREDQVEYHKKRALRKIEEGSEYSSDFESVDESDYVTTDGEGSPTREIHNAANIKVVRGSTPPGQSKRSSVASTPGELLANIGAADPELIHSHRKTGSFGAIAENQQKVHETDPD